MKPLLFVTNPRRIPAAIEAFRALPIDVAFVSGYTQSQAVGPIAELIESTDYDVYLACADDCVVDPSAVDAVLALLDEYPVATGWCRLDRTHDFANITTEPLRGDRPVEDAYSWWRADDVFAYPSVAVPTFFTGMCLTAMSRDLWLRYPYRVYGESGPGYSSDFRLSVRLRDDGVPIVAAREGYVEHLKERWLRLDEDPEMRLLIGEIPAEVTIETAADRGFA